MIVSLQMKDFIDQALDINRSFRRLADKKDWHSLASRLCNLRILTDHGIQKIFSVMRLQCLLRAFADSM